MTNGPTDYYTKWSKSERLKKKNTVWYHLHVKSKIQHKQTYLLNRNRLTNIENRLVVAKGRAEGGVNWEFGELVDHWLNGHEFEQSLGDSEGQGSLVCCSTWGHKELEPMRLSD